MIVNCDNYKVHFNSPKGYFEDFSFDNYSITFVIVDENTLKYCYPKIRIFLPPHELIQITSGEAAKDIYTCEYIWKQIRERKGDRESLVINLGGGVIGDMGGFCAATYMRGIDFIQIPTTLLSMVDASIGGKLAVNFQGSKNHIGLFQNPKEILIYTAFLDTLSVRQRRNGFAEMLKHGLIRSNNYWNALCRNSFESISEKLIIESVNFKKEIVEEDFKEVGLRKLLNFGHTIGHGIESQALKENLNILHGEAVLIGMFCETYISFQRGRISIEDKDEILNNLWSIYPFEKKVLANKEGIFSWIIHDKKNKGNRINMVLLEEIGRGIVDQIVSKEEIISALSFAQEYA